MGPTLIPYSDSEYAPATHGPVHSLVDHARPRVLGAQVAFAVPIVREGVALAGAVVAEGAALRQRTDLADGAPADARGAIIHVGHTRVARRLQLPPAGVGE